MEFSQVVFISESLDRLEFNRQREQYRMAAYNAYLMGAASNKTLSQYMKFLGLSDEQYIEDPKSNIDRCNKMGSIVRKLKWKKSNVSRET